MQGRSNYLAVFIGCALLVSTFCKKAYRDTPVFCTALDHVEVRNTVGFDFLGYRVCVLAKILVFTVVVSGIMQDVAWHLAAGIYEFLDPALPEALRPDSVKIRLEASLATIKVIQLNPLVEVSRSFYKDVLESMIPGPNLWDLHNWILHPVVSFGLIGLVLSRRMSHRCSGRFSERPVQFVSGEGNAEVTR